MDDDFPVPVLGPRDDSEQPTSPDLRDVEQAQQARDSVPPESETEGGSVDPIGGDRYVIPDPDQLVPTYVRNETPWVGFSSPMEEAPVASDEPEFTRIVRRRRRWREMVAWCVTGVFIVTAAWFLPTLLAPTSDFGRVGSFVALALGGLAVLAVLWRTWRWAHHGG